MDKAVPENPADECAGFVERVRAQRQLWGLQSDEGWAVCESIEFEDSEVFPFWSDKEEARVHCEGEWKIFRPAAISLEDYLSDWLPGMHEDHVLVGPDWDRELSGPEVEPADLAAWLDPEAEYRAE